MYTRVGYGLRPLLLTQITVSTVSIGLSTIPDAASLAVIQVQGQPVRYRDDGGAPTAAVGMRADAGTVLVAELGALGSIRFIREGANDAVLNVSYYGL